jgi:hypothetical protein
MALVAEIGASRIPQIAGRGSIKRPIRVNFAIAIDPGFTVILSIGFGCERDGERLS